MAKREEKTGAWFFRLIKTTKFEGMKQLNVIPISSIKKVIYTDERIKSASTKILYKSFWFKVHMLKENK